MSGGCVTLDKLIEALRVIENNTCVAVLQDFLYERCANQRRHVFVTYAANHHQMEHVVELCRFIRCQNFFVGVDVKEASLEQTDSRLKKANFILVLVSPLYNRIVTNSQMLLKGGWNATSRSESNLVYGRNFTGGSLRNNSDNNCLMSHRNLVHIFDFICRELQQPGSAATVDGIGLPCRIIPVMMPEATPADIPSPLRDCKPVFYWPSDRTNLVDAMQ